MLKNNQFVHLLPGNMYHIYNRGNNSENIFKEEKNYGYFLSRWNKYITPVANTHAYTLLRNHFHSQVRIKEEEEIRAGLFFSRPSKAENQPVEKIISQCFANFFNSYAKSINKSYGRNGSLFQERFKRKIIDSDSYFTEITFYIHGNAQRHKFCNDFRKYPHSSYMPLLSAEPTFLQRDDVLSWFGGVEAFKKYHEEYRESRLDASKFLENEGDD